ncbi:hypothetical protein [Rhizobium paknamense]|uniref:HAD family hydrolase n=1 Tax=Rhizobium paknamense TaxID=1206817 RepID=A0ABU0I8R8_9HYPH|nr:hypothetical protein [Rhizobium paknamense]MDQ0453998.1 hypothetical protein [Rhizobium paknamense]
MSELTDLDHVTLSQRPLAVCDVDDVVLEFLRPFEAYLESLGHRLLPRSFRLHGNIISRTDERALEDGLVTDILHAFFENQITWQKPFGSSVESLKRIGQSADVVFLTAMPPRYAQHRRALLDGLGLDFPLVATESPKGPVVNRLHGDRALPVAFIDDMAHNLHSVGEAVPHCLLVQLMPESEIHRHAPKPGPNVVRAMDWEDAEQRLLGHFSA